MRYVTEPKIDGLSINLLYEKGLLVHGATRGDGFRGENVTPNLKTIRAIAMRMRLGAKEKAPPLLEARGEVYLPLSGFNELNARLDEGRQEADPEPAQRCGWIAPTEGSVDHGVSPALNLDPRSRPQGRPADRGPLGLAAVASRARVPHEPLRGAPRLDRIGRGDVPGVGEAQDRARLRDRRDRHQGRLVRATGAPWRAAPSTALGARLQVGADDRDDAAQQDPHPRGADGGAQPVGAARAGRGRGRDGLARDAPQRGGHQPQGDSRRATW